MSTPRAPAVTPPSPSRRGQGRRGGTAGDMVRSMLVIVALVAIVYVAVPRPQGRIQQPVDVGAAVADASGGGVAVDAPQVPRSWKANLSTFEPDPQEGLPTLSLGWSLPAGTYAGVRATTGATPTWITSVTGAGDPRSGATVTLSGREWQEAKGTDDARRRSLVLSQPADGGGGAGAGVTYVVTGTAPEADLERVAAEVVPG